MKIEIPNETSERVVENTSSDRTERSSRKSEKPKKLKKKTHQVPRGALEARLLNLISRHPKGMSLSPLMTAGTNLGSTENSTKQCLRRLVKAGKLLRTNRGWRIPQGTSGIEKLTPELARGSAPKSISTEDRDLEMAVLLAEIERLPKERLARVRYLASLIATNKVRIPSKQG